MGDAASNWFDAQLERFTSLLFEAAGNLAGDIATAWVNFPLVPQLGEWVGGGVCDPITGECTDPRFQPADVFVFFAQELRWWSLAFVVLGLIVAGIRIMWTQEGRHLKDVLQSLITFVLITASGTAVVALLLSAGDEFSVYILNRATEDGGIGEGITRVLFLNEGSEFWLEEQALGWVMAILLLLVAVLVFLLQVILLVVRGALLVVMVAMLPVAAAAAGTQVGKQMLGKYTAWLLALILYKPAAAVIYAVAFRLSQSDASLLAAVTAIAIFICALFMLPALLRLIVPATSAVASGGGAGGLVAAGAGAAVATGAVAMTGGAGAASAGGAGAASGSASRAPGAGSAGAGSISGGGSASGGGSGRGGPGGSKPGPAGGPGGGGTSGGQDSGAGVAPAGGDSGPGGQPSAGGSAPSAGGPAGGDSGPTVGGTGGGTSGFSSSSASGASSVSQAAGSSQDSGSPDGGQSASGQGGGSVPSGGQHGPARQRAAGAGAGSPAPSGEQAATGGPQGSPAARAPSDTAKRAGRGAAAGRRAFDEAREELDSEEGGPRGSN
ncbi:hypothetical protein ACI3EY_16980 [Ornithinimicrobium sp. LYQ92]|uniref:hypothetical protein n=1 Tax=Serinicoccus sp. LYQ92 TaxID=3378798 RepID=UPI0038547B84